MNYEFLSKLAERRSKIYWFLSDFYLRKPDEKFIEELRTKIAQIGEKVGEELEGALRKLKSALDDPNTEELSRRLSIEFTRLFRGVKKGYGPPPPYESVYRGEGRVLGEVTLEVMRAYLEAGFGLIDEYAGPQDYIGTELRFMSFLCYKEMESWKGGKPDDGKRYLEMEIKFLNEHLFQFVARFYEKVKEEAREEFYVGVLELTKGFIEMEIKGIELILKEIAEGSH